MGESAKVGRHGRWTGVCARARRQLTRTQVGFVKQKAVIKVHVEKRINEIVNRLNKTKTEMSNVDFRAQREERDRCVRACVTRKLMRLLQKGTRGQTGDCT